MNDKRKITIDQVRDIVDSDYPGQYGSEISSDDVAESEFLDYSNDWKDYTLTTNDNKDIIQDGARIASKIVTNLTNDSILLGLDRLKDLDLNKKIDLDEAKSILSGFDPLKYPIEPIVEWFKTTFNKYPVSLQKELISSIPPTVIAVLLTPLGPEWLGALNPGVRTALSEPLKLIVRMNLQGAGQAGAELLNQIEKKQPIDSSEVLKSFGGGAALEFIGSIPSSIKSAAKKLTGIPDEVFRTYGEQVVRADPKSAVASRGGIMDLSNERQALTRDYVDGKLSQSEFNISDAKTYQKEVERFKKLLSDPNTVKQAAETLKEVFGRPYLDMSVFTNIPESLKVSKPAMAQALKEVLTNPPGLQWLKDLSLMGIGPTINKISEFISAPIARATSRITIPGNTLGTAIARGIKEGISSKDIKGEDSPDNSLKTSAIETLNSPLTRAVSESLNNIKNNKTDIGNLGETLLEALKKRNKQK